MKSHRSFVYVVIAFIFCLLISIHSEAQPTGGGPTEPAPFGFVEVLIGAGLVYGGKKAYAQRSNK
ncbi:MAG: hypothetical protein HWE14_11380 [Flavobacteriia bacterium]|nr:hypothetical protein [Flavobacteriia bacterium]